jgi:SPP1 family predicted phage head-tail adaptor
MQAGKLDRRVTFRRATVTQNALNEDVSAWADLATVSASKEDISDAERMRAAQTGASVTTRFQVRYSSVTASLTPRDQLVCEGRLYDIAAKKELGRRDGFEITANAQADAP